MTTLSPEIIDGTVKSLSRFVGMAKAKEYAEKGLISDIIIMGKNSDMANGSTDVGDFSKCVPTAQCLISTAAFATPLHSWQRVSQGKTEIAKKGMDRAVGTLALTAIRALNNPEIIKKAKEELIEERGEKYISPIPKELKIRDPKIQA